MPEIAHHSRIHTSHGHHHPLRILSETCISSRWNSKKRSHCCEPPTFRSPQERTCNANNNTSNHCRSNAPPQLPPSSLRHYCTYLHLDLTLSQLHLCTCSSSQVAGIQQQQKPPPPHLFITIAANSPSSRVVRTCSLHSSSLFVHAAVAHHHHHFCICTVS